MSLLHLAEAVPTRGSFTEDTRTLCRDAHGSLLRPWHLLTTRAGIVARATFVSNSESTSSPPPSLSRERQGPEELPGAGVLREPTQGPHLPALSRETPAEMADAVSNHTCKSPWRLEHAHPWDFNPLLVVSCSLANFSVLGIKSFSTKPVSLFLIFSFFEISHWWGW